MSTVPIVIVMARWHAANRCKKRLAKDIGIERAANIQKMVTSHTLQVASLMQEKGLAEIHLSVSGLGPKACNRWGNAENINNVSRQGSGNLGLRMRREVLRVLAKQINSSIKSREIIVIGTDLPTLCKNDLLEAFSSLKSHDMVLGPSKDGGYWLIGFSKKLLNPLPNWPFSGIPWGTSNVLKTTRDKTIKKGFALHLLHEQNDLDQLDDLDPWLRQPRN